MFTRFKQELRDTLDRIMDIIVGMLRILVFRLFKAPGVDSTKIEVYSKKDRGPARGGTI
ncbi:hypothetical protein MCP_1937 [Methanocella paludicola SANAE]|uniref:Uncharacterized protein n=1 Tax=Methanocella paludicola (strain DSM 17711 / JCM 13418 / NBRC 101707 / SANAE) TaxID=304371 RepID=D1YZY7_METPS|nr:hypothetical protein [Methanocella paludicola]BAI62009.1 hypothetical protein MCP_1937 [Methanocella paludicola SANAE]